MAGRVKEILPYMNLYGRDLFTDPKVEAMTTEQVGAHCLLIMRAWYETPGGSVPDDNKTLSRWVQAASVEHWLTFKDGVMTAWDLKDGRWFQKRVVREFREAVQKQRKAKAAATERWKNVKNDRNAGVMRPHNGRNAIRSDQIRSDQNKAEQKGEGPPPAPPSTSSVDPVHEILRVTGLAINGNDKVKSRISRIVLARGPETALFEVRRSLEAGFGGANAVKNAADRIFANSSKDDSDVPAPTTRSKIKVGKSHS